MMMAISLPPCPAPAARARALARRSHPARTRTGALALLPHPSALSPWHSTSARKVVCMAENGKGTGGEAGAGEGDPPAPGVTIPPPPERKKVRRKAESTDAVATFLTRRFGIAGGLAWLGLLTFGVVSEQVKTRLEVASEINNTVDATDAQELVTPSGLRYTDVRIGGGASPRRGDIVAVNIKLSARNKPIVYLFGSKPYTAGNCKGVEEALSTMRVGGIRTLVVPPELAFGDTGFELRATDHVPDKSGSVPGGVPLEYTVALVRSSIPPS